MKKEMSYFSRSADAFPQWEVADDVDRKQT